MARNVYFRILLACSPAGPLLALLAGTPAVASEDLTIYSDHSTLITLPKRPATVIVGNPSIADVTLDGERLFLHGRGFGNTNVTILDATGHAIGDYEIFVTLPEANSASVFKSGARQTYSCAGDCQPVLTVGDLYKPHYENLAEAMKTKSKISRDQTGGNETSAPVIMPAPISQ